MSRREEDIIQGAHAASDTYMEVKDGVMRLKDEAFVGTDKLSLIEQVARRYIKVDKEEVCKGTESSADGEQIDYLRRQLILKYDDGSTTLAVPVADIIIQYDTEMEDSSELCVGIPQQTLGTLHDMLSKALSDSPVVLPWNSQIHSGHAWIQIKCLASIPGTYASKNGSEEIDDTRKLLKSLKTNLLADGFFHMHVKRALPDPAKGDKDEDKKPWVLHMTAGFVQAIGTTDVGCAKGITGRQHDVSEELEEAVKDMKAGADELESETEIGAESDEGDD